MRVTVGNTWARLDGLTPDQYRVASDAASLHYEGWVSKKMFGRILREKVTFSCRLWERSEGLLHIPAGIIHVVLDELRDVFGDLDVDLKYHPSIDPQHMIHPYPRPDYLPATCGITLRDYQQEAVDVTLESRTGIVCIPTGGGKTVVLSSIIWRSGVAHSLVLVPNLTLLKQTRDVLCSVFGPKAVGVIGGNNGWTLGTVTVATTKKLDNLLKIDPRVTAWFGKVGLLVMDEAHHVNLRPQAHKTTLWYNLAMRCPAYWRVGMTATPGDEGTAQRLLLEAATGPVVTEMTTSEAVDGGFLVPADVLLFPVVHPIKLPWPDAYDSIMGTRRTALVVSLAIAERSMGRSVLIIVDRVGEHGAKLAGMIPGSVFLHGQVDSDLRHQEIQRFREHGGILIGTVFGEGVDIPALDTVIMAAGGRSKRLVVQRVGRALRPHEGKGRAKIIDFIDDDQDGVLSRHSRARRAVYESEPRFTVTVVGQKQPVTT